DVLIYGNGVDFHDCVKITPGNWGQVKSQAPVDWPVPVPTCLPAGACVPGTAIAPTSVNGVACMSPPVVLTKPGLYCSASSISP
ncbi:hypothetical protein NL529_31980, partial [Klebsiella pneumoniae]|nr:hypothetical protein [Klebsiella pneumoniae]